MIAAAAKNGCSCAVKNKYLWLALLEGLKSGRGSVDGTDTLLWQIPHPLDRIKIKPSKVWVKEGGCDLPVAGGGRKSFADCRFRGWLC